MARIAEVKLFVIPLGAILQTALVEASERLSFHRMVASCKSRRVIVRVPLLSFMERFSCAILRLLDRTDVNLVLACAVIERFFEVDWSLLGG